MNTLVPRRGGACPFAPEESHSFKPISGHFRAYLETPPPPPDKNINTDTDTDTNALYPITARARHEAAHLAHQRLQNFELCRAESEGPRSELGPHPGRLARLTPARVRWTFNQAAPPPCPNTVHGARAAQCGSSSFSAACKMLACAKPRGDSHHMRCASARLTPRREKRVL